jgi:hypothetical protein
MRLYIPIYPGDSVQEPGIIPGGDAVNSWKIPLFWPILVRRTMRAGKNSVAAANADRPEQRMPAKQGAWVGSKLKFYYEALVRKFESGGQAELENYLAASQNLADLEERIRRYERMQSRYY